MIKILKNIYVTNDPIVIGNASGDRDFIDSFTVTVEVDIKDSNKSKDTKMITRKVANLIQDDIVDTIETAISELMGETE